MKNLKTNELLKLTNELIKLEISTLNSMGLKNISGGFATANMFDYDNKFIDIELTFGVISDSSYWKEIEQLKINRKNFKIIN
jgi:hypothetical protein